MVFQVDSSHKRSVKPWDLLNPETKYVDDKTYSERLNICRSCEHFFKPTSLCKKCGCFMKVKCAMEQAFCPIDKWKAVTN